MTAREQQITATNCALGEQENQRAVLASRSANLAGELAVLKS
jgi:hypothetical protein